MESRLSRCISLRLTTTTDPDSVFPMNSYSLKSDISRKWDILRNPRISNQRLHDSADTPSASDR